MPHGQLAHWQIATRSLPATRDFYRDLFGWTVIEPPGMENLYAIVDGAGLEGGVSVIPMDQEPKVTLFFSVDSIESTLAQAVALGAAIVTPKTPIGSGAWGWYAAIRDPGGATIGLHEQA